MDASRRVSNGVESSNPAAGVGAFLSSLSGVAVVSMLLVMMSSVIGVVVWGIVVVMMVLFMPGGVIGEKATLLALAMFLALSPYLSFVVDAGARRVLGLGNRR